MAAPHLGISDDHAEMAKSLISGDTSGLATQMATNHLKSQFGFSEAPTSALLDNPVIDEAIGNALFDMAFAETGQEVTDPKQAVLILQAAFKLKPEQVEEVQKFV